jgi:hypothetical protein
LRIDANGNVISIILTPGQQYESAAFFSLRLCASAREKELSV